MTMPTPHSCSLTQIASATHPLASVAKVFFTPNASDVEQIDSKLRSGNIVKKFSERSNVYQFVKGAAVSAERIVELKSDNLCGAYFRIFSDNIRMDVRPVAEMLRDLTAWGMWVAEQSDSLGCSSTNNAVANQQKVLYACVDPLGIQMHRPLLGENGEPALDYNGLVQWRSMRGTNRVEAFWAAAGSFTPPVSAGEDYSVALVRTGLARYNAERRRDAGRELNYRHYNFWLVERANFLSRGLLAQRPFEFDAHPPAHSALQSVKEVSMLSLLFPTAKSCGPIETTVF